MIVLTIMFVNIHKKHVKNKLSIQKCKLYNIYCPIKKKSTNRFLYKIKPETCTKWVINHSTIQQNININNNNNITDGDN